MSQTNTLKTNQKEEEERPSFVKSQNFKHSSNMQFPDEPPTDRQIKYIRDLKIKFGVTTKIELPKTRLEAHKIIDKLLNGENL